MNVAPSLPVAFLPIARHGVIGDRRTGALIGADGTVSWFCVPDFDGPPLFGALLDPERGGGCRFGPRSTRLGRQRYVPGTASLQTLWTDDAQDTVLELTDTMAWPALERLGGKLDQRIIIRRLRALQDAAVRFEVDPRRNFAATHAGSQQTENGAAFSFADGSLGVWASFPLKAHATGAFADLDLSAGEEHWLVLGWNADPKDWDSGSAAQACQAAEQYWRDWSAGLQVADGGPRAAALVRTALTVQLLSHTEHNSAVAALTTSLPERLGGDRNYDYRFAWVRDASLSLAFLARLGKADEVECYLRWLCRLPSATDAPLQVCYRLDGDPHLEQENIAGVYGYENSQPVCQGNRAAKQKQIGAFGFFADCARLYLDHGGAWAPEFWELLQKGADYTCQHWQEKDSGVWELTQHAHYVASKVMSWVVLERAVYVAEKTGHASETDRWKETATAIHAEVMDQGWCAEKNSFRQRYGSDALDAGALLIGLMEFLPIDHPRVAGTLAALERELVVDGLMHRFDPAATLGGEQLPIGRFEGAFLPCVFWHAHTLAKAGRCDEAEAILSRIEAISGETGLFAEEVDARQHIFLGNTPQLFSHVEYARAAIALHQARTRTGATAE